jgi:regulatory protein
MSQKTFTKDELLHKAASYCSLSERCISEVEDKLSDWGAAESEKNGIIKYLTTENYINQERYCRFYIKDKIKFNKWGKNKIAFALRSKKIEQGLITDSLNGVDEDEYLEILLSILKGKISTIKYNSEYEKRGKLIRFALSRGFESNAIEAVLKTMKIREE